MLLHHCHGVRKATDVILMEIGAFALGTETVPGLKELVKDRTHYPSLSHGFLFPLLLLFNFLSLLPGWGCLLEVSKRPGLWLCICFACHVPNFAPLRIQDKPNRFSYYASTTQTSALIKCVRAWGVAVQPSKQLALKQAPAQSWHCLLEHTIRCQATAQSHETVLRFRCQF